MNYSALGFGRNLATLLIAIVAIPAFAVEPATERSPSRTEVKAEEAINFSLLDYKGRYYELRRSEAKVVVLFFTSFSCPIARQSTPKLKSLRTDFGNKGVELWLINSCTADDPDDSMIELMMSRKRSLVPDAAFADIEAVKVEMLKGLVGGLPILRDEHQLVARRFGVNRTCEVIAIDTKSSKIIYRGAIDDQSSEGSQKPAALTNYIANALNEFLAGKAVANPTTKAHGCRITFQTEDPKELISYSKEIAPLLQKNCVGCHSPGQIGPFAMSSYKKVKGWSAMIEEVVLDRRMPPWHADPHYGKFANDRALTSSESHTLLNWIEQGCPRGEGADPLTNASPPVVEWTLGKPDYIVPIPEEQKIPATGTMKYIYLDSDFAMPEDGWVRAAVCRPGNPTVVHHIIVRALYPKGYKDAPSEAYLFTTWVPGLAAAEFPKGTGMYLPKGSRFNFELHYTTMGEATTDRSEVGLYLAKDPPNAGWKSARVICAISQSSPATRTQSTSACIASKKMLSSMTSALTCISAVRGSNSNCSTPTANVRHCFPCHTTISTGKPAIASLNPSAYPQGHGCFAPGRITIRPQTRSTPTPPRPSHGDCKAGTKCSWAS